MSELPFEVTKVFYMLAAVWDKYFTIIKQGGTSSSKTYTIMQWLALKAIEKRRSILVVGQDIPNMKVGALRDLENIMSNPKLSLYLVKGQGGSLYNKSSLTFKFKNGSIIEFKSYGDGQDAKSGKRDITFFNEVNGISKDVYDEISDRTYEKVIMDYNPTARFWVHDELLSDEDTIRLISNFTHNRFCPAQTIKKLLRYRRTNKYRWRVYGLGLTGVVEGIVFPNVNWIKESEWPGDHNLDRFGFGLDYGFAVDPMAMGKAGLYRGEIFAKGLIYKTGLRLPTLVKYMDRLGVDDHLVSMDDSQAKEQSEILKEDHYFNIKSANRRGGSIQAGINLLQDYPLNIVYNKAWQIEQTNYCFRKKLGVTEARPIDKWNHYWDQLRYWGLEQLVDTEIYEEYIEEAAVL